MIRVGIIGATGYTGAELFRLLFRHGQVEITMVTSRQYEGKLLSDIYPAFRNITDILLEAYDLDKIREKCDLVFTALPHEVPMNIVPELIQAGVRVVDLSADFRFSTQEYYENFYCPHKAPEYIEQSVYGLSEVFTEKIESASLIGNPGCYPTCSLIPLLPLAMNNLISVNDIIIDAKSGVSGAGRVASEGNHFCHVNENFKAYKVGSHRHRPEIEDVLTLLSGERAKVLFTPHLLPLTRGMLATIYLSGKTAGFEVTVRQTLMDFYKDSYFIRVLPEGQFPSISDVVGTNFCDIGFKYDENSERLIIVSVIDNLIKGASGQAVQNMNIMFGLNENEGLLNMAYSV